MIEKYVASYINGGAKLAKIHVLKETPKTYLLEGKPENIVGTFYYLPTRLNKAEYNVFDSQKEALEFLSSKAKVYAEAMRNGAYRADKQVEELEQRIEEQNQC